MTEKIEFAPLRVGVVGSRRRNTLVDRRMILHILRRVVSDHPGRRIIVVSGGCRGPDTYAEEAARALGLETEIFPVPTDPPITSRWDFSERAKERNTVIADRSDILYALVAPDRRGGTEDTVMKHAGLGFCAWGERKTILVLEDGSEEHVTVRAYLDATGTNTHGV